MRSIAKDYFNRALIAAIDPKAKQNKTPFILRKTFGALYLRKIDLGFRAMRIKMTIQSELS
jgi:hypothetical protein